MKFKELSKFNVKISVIPNRLGKYMAFTINKNIIFIDSMQFMNSSLDSLVKNLIREDFKCFSEEFSDEKLKLVKEKGIYPYEYMDSFKRFNEDKLPDKSKFFISLKDSCISEQDYDRAIKVWNVFKRKTLSEYHYFYLKEDVLLLADVFEKFLKTCLDFYGLDPSHYFSAPGESWEAILKMTKIKQETFSDIDVHLFIEKVMRGGISYICKRFAAEDNKFIKNHDSCKESKLINLI